MRIRHCLMLLALAGGAAFYPFTPVKAGVADLVFSEVMYNPDGSDEKHEWVELYNSGTEEITITAGSGEGSWRFFDGSNHVLTLVQGDGIIAASEFTILASDATTFLADHPTFTGDLFDTVMSLSNTTDTLKLSPDKGETYFLEFTYQSEQGGNGDNTTLEREQPASGVWRSSIMGGTPGLLPVTPDTKPDEETEAPIENTATSTPPTIPSGGANAPVADPKKIRISEVLANPETGGEFIELWNNNPASITLEGWKIADAAKVSALPKLTLVPGEYRALYQEETKLVLNNSNEKIALYAATGDLVSSLEYATSTKGFSFSYNQKDDTYTWTSTPTPGNANDFTVPNIAPIAVITIERNPVAPGEYVALSAAQSSDADGDALNFLWRIGPNFQANGSRISYAFDTIGTHTVWLTVNDTHHNITATSSIEVLPWVQVLGARTNLAATSNPTASTTKIEITELLPNPAGQDTDEWIELYNPTDADVTLDGWSIDDSEGGSKPFSLDGITIPALSYLTIERSQSKLQLNNTRDSVRLLGSNGIVVDSVLYATALEDQSYNKISGDDWSWLPESTPGDENEIPVTSIAPSNQVTLARTNYPTNIVATSSADYPIDADPEELRDLEPGTLVRVQGVVAVAPNVLAKTYFYLAGQPGIQVYFSRHEWPDIVAGDAVGIIGTLAEASNELRIKIIDRDDIQILYRTDPPTPSEAETGEINEALEGSLVQITGQLMQKRGASWYVDDGSGEARLVFQELAHITKPEVIVGEWVSATGIVSQTTSGYRLLARSSDDVSRIDAPETQGEVLGARAAAAATQQFTIPANNQAKSLALYFGLTAAALLAITAILAYRMYKQKQLLEEKAKNNKS